VKVYPTPLGTSLGVRTDAHARALDAAGAPIDGLYVCGNDMQSIMGGEYRARARRSHRDDVRLRRGDARSECYALIARLFGAELQPVRLPPLDRPLEQCGGA